MFIRSTFVCLFFIVVACEQPQNQNDYEYIDLSGFEDGIHHWNLYSPIRSEARLDTGDIIGIAENLLAYQNLDGGWPKNIDWLSTLNPDSVITSLSDKYRKSTFDNRNIYPQIKYLSHVYSQTGRAAYKQAAIKGFRYILNNEHEKGGWRGWDADVITFNDDVMTGIMDLLLDVIQNSGLYDYLDEGLEQKIIAAYEHGLKVILSTQIELNGKKTAWCQQHDFYSHKPVQGRAYEHPSITARESCDILIFLMKIDKPEPEVIDAIHSGVEWLEEVGIRHMIYKKVPIEPRPYHETTIDFDFVFEPDTTARPVWSRYYDLIDGKPFLSLRDGTIVYNLSEISFDRRVGYAWYGYWPERVFDQYKIWSARIN